MKSARIICLLFLFVSISNYANFNPAILASYNDGKELIDSLYFSQNQVYLNKKDAQTIIDTYKKEINKGVVLVEEDLKRIAIGYSVLNNATKSSEYLEEYIKKSHNFNIFESQNFSNIANTNEFIALSKNYKPKLNFWFLSYFYIGLIGIFIAIILNLRKESDRIANLFISLFIFLSSIFIIHVCLFISNVQYYVPHSLFITISFNFLYGPLLYFYFKRTTKQSVLKLSDALHLIPFLAVFIYFLKYYVLSSDAKLHILLNRAETFDPVLTYLVIFKIISLVVYGILIYKLCISSKGKRFNFENNVIYKWQRIIVYLNSIYVFSHLLYVLLIFEILPINFLIHPQIISMSLLVIYVGYSAYVQPKVFNKKYYSSGLLYYKYEKSGLTESYSNELKDQLLKLIYDEKIYKENKITLDALSERLGTTRHSTSQVINEHFGLNFFNFINKFRIKEAQKMFKSDINNNLNVIDVAYDVGFNNKVTFNKAFKEETKLTPTQYIKSLNANKRQFANYKVNFK